MTADAGLFAGLDVAGAEDLTGLPEGTFPAVVSKAERLNGTKNSPDKTFLLIEYSIDEMPFPAREYKWVPTAEDLALDSRKAGLAVSFLKSRLTDLGVPLNKMNSLNPDDLVGLDVIITLKRNGDYTNVTKVALDEGVSPDVGFEGAGSFDGFGG